MKAPPVGSRIYDLCSRSPAQSQCSRSPLPSDLGQVLVPTLPYTTPPPTPHPRPTYSPTSIQTHSHHYPHPSPASGRLPPHTSPLTAQLSTGDVGMPVTHRRHHQGLSSPLLSNRTLPPSLFPSHGFVTQLLSNESVSSSAIQVVKSRPKTQSSQWTQTEHARTHCG